MKKILLSVVRGTNERVPLETATESVPTRHFSEWEMSRWGHEEHEERWNGVSHCAKARYIGDETFYVSK